ncbi:hypothetical protein HPP92_001691 [Vanilla planifolia]|uniref:Uncharacterized protein n=1 Tax=Vanilla planifolia TaxID=51239 RepID=A0A835RR48_VANPL|nr:hypothetical protein HPP92_001691 [Vanilla planifolia]
MSFVSASRAPLCSRLAQESDACGDVHRLPLGTRVRACENSSLVALLYVAGATCWEKRCAEDAYRFASLCAQAPGCGRAVLSLFDGGCIWTGYVQGM